MPKPSFKEDFHRMVVGDTVLIARMTGAGPYLRAEGAERGHVVLGNVTRLRLIEGCRPTWAICKYREPRIFLHDIRRAEAEKVAREFGLSFQPACGSNFYGSNCFTSMARWISEHPLEAEEMARMPSAFAYLGDWLSKAEEATLELDDHSQPMLM